MNIWFTADTHFDHFGILKYRPYDDLKSMDDGIIENWNKVVKKRDVVYHLGDFCWSHHVSDWQNYALRLHGWIHLIRGNHDLPARKIGGIFKSVNDLLVFRQDKQKIVLCHYAMRTWSASHHGSWQLYGHSHGSMEPIGKQMDVGLDAHGMFPISLDQVIKKMLLKPDTPVIDHHGRKDE